MNVKKQNIPFGVTTLKALFETFLGDSLRLPPGDPLLTIEKSNGMGGMALTSIFPLKT